LTALPELRAWLGEAFIVPEDLAVRLRARIQGDPARREAARVLAGLLDTGWRTAALLWSDEELR
jgi:hypothetical protein